MLLEVTSRPDAEEDPFVRREAVLWAADCDSASAEDLERVAEQDRSRVVRNEAKATARRLEERHR